MYFGDVQKDFRLRPRTDHTLALEKGSTHWCVHSWFLFSFRFYLLITYARYGSFELPRGISFYLLACRWLFAVSFAFLVLSAGKMPQNLEQDVPLHYSQRRRWHAAVACSSTTHRYALVRYSECSRKFFFLFLFGLLVCIHYSWTTRFGCFAMRLRLYAPAGLDAQSAPEYSDPTYRLSLSYRFRSFLFRVRDAMFHTGRASIFPCCARLLISLLCSAVAQAGDGCTWDNSLWPSTTLPIT